MVEREFSETHLGNQVRQQASVPFLWEEKPGIPKKGWKLNNVPVNVPPPLKLITSVPFKWEEKPGKPLSCFSEPPHTDSPQLALPPAKLIGFPSPLAYSSSSSPIRIRSKLSNIFPKRRNYGDDEDRNVESEFEDEEENDEEQEMFISSPSLIPHGLVSTFPMSNPFPVDQAKVNVFSTSTEEENEELEELNSPDSETESNLSSYATGSTSLTGASFLDTLFPLYSPDAGFLDKVGSQKKRSSVTFSDHKIIIGLQSNSNNSIVVRRTLTLRQLMEMSRKFSYQKKTDQISKRDIPLVIICLRPFTINCICKFLLLKKQFLLLVLRITNTTAKIK